MCERRSYERAKKFVCSDVSDVFRTVRELEVNFTCCKRRLKPNSITLAGSDMVRSELVGSWFEAGSKIA